MDFRLHPRAPLLLTVWLSIPGALLCPFVFWQSVPVGAAFLLFWLAASITLGSSLGYTLRGSARAGQLTVTCGILFKSTWRLPLRFITGISRLESPLMQMSHCCALVVHTSGRSLLLPALSNAVALQLTAFLQQEARR